ncbi:MAG: hypothetical protein ABIQ74_07645 [Chitinophagales bacterium]
MSNLHMARKNQNTKDQDSGNGSDTANSENSGSSTTKQPALIIVP